MTESYQCQNCGTVRAKENLKGARIWHPCPECESVETFDRVRD